MTFDEAALLIRVLNVFLAPIALVIAILSLRDGIRMEKRVEKLWREYRSEQE